MLFDSGNEAQAVNSVLCRSIDLADVNMIGTSERTRHGCRYSAMSETEMIACGRTERQWGGEKI